MGPFLGTNSGTSGLRFMAAWGSETTCMLGGGGGAGKFFTIKSGEISGTIVGGPMG